MDKNECYKPMPGYENLYQINKKGTVKSLPREINSYGKVIMLKQNPVETIVRDKVIYALIRDCNFKNKKVNISKMIRNLFGRQTKIILKQPVKKTIEVSKPVNKAGRAGIPIEQWDEGKCIKVFESLASAANAVGGESRHISDVCYGKRNFYLGYKWKFHKS